MYLRTTKRKNKDGSVVDFLQAHSAAVEEAVFFRTAHLFNLDVDLIFYDTTTAVLP
jgi:hypothetical protein